jgi:hypothetical protein
VDLFIVQPGKIELINAKKLPYSSFPTFDSSDMNDAAGDDDVCSVSLAQRPIFRISCGKSQDIVGAKGNCLE